MNQNENKDDEKNKKIEFIRKINDIQNSVGLGMNNSLGITGRGMLLSGNGHTFNMREAKY